MISTSVFGIFNVFLLVARIHERRAGNPGDCGHGERVSKFIFWGLQAIAIVHAWLKWLVSPTNEKVAKLFDIKRRFSLIRV